MFSMLSTLHDVEQVKESHFIVQYSLFSSRSICVYLSFCGQRLSTHNTISGATTFVGSFRVS